MNVHLKAQTRAHIIRIHGALRELKNLAEAERCDLLSHLLAMAYLESGDILRGVRPARSVTRGNNGNAGGSRITRDG